jgi:pimeloyl-ACP methyl ester carboxylesterase
MIVNANGIDLYVEQQGAGAPAFVFLHYWGGSTRTWDHVVDLLTPDARTIAIDHRGWGRSAAPDSGYALADMADDAQGVIAALDLERYILVGHSMGGKVAQLMASRHPQGLVGLALVAPAPPVPMALPLAVRQGMVGAYDTAQSIMATLDQVLAPGGLHHDDLATVIADSMAGAAPARQAWPLHSSQEDISAVMADIAVPVIVISGENDRVDPPGVLARELVARLPGAQLHVLPGVGHLSPLEAPDDVADLLRGFALSLSGEERCVSCGAPSQRFKAP